METILANADILGTILFLIGAACLMIILGWDVIFKFKPKPKNDGTRYRYTKKD